MINLVKNFALNSLCENQQLKDLTKSRDCQNITRSQITYFCLNLLLISNNCV